MIKLLFLLLEKSLFFGELKMNTKSIEFNRSQN